MALFFNVRIQFDIYLSVDGSIKETGQRLESSLCLQGIYKKC